MNILGINSYFEHPAVALIRDGELVFAMEEERITRIKHGKSYTPYKTYIPFATIHAALKSEGLHADELDEVTYSYSSNLHLRSLWGCFTGKRKSSLREEIAAYQSAKNVRHALRDGHELPTRFHDLMPRGSLGRVPYTEWDHHLSHAASAFFCSGYERSLVVVSDGSGENACTSVYIGQGHELRKIAEITLPNSLGFFYSHITEHLGFEPFSDEYKVMGLAAYGQPTFDDDMQQILPLLPGGRYRLDVRKIAALSERVGPKRGPSEALTQRHSDLACSAQKRLEECVEHIAQHFLSNTGLDCLCLAGGTFLNVLANERLARLKSVKHIFIQPGAHDAGTAIGAAALSWNRLNRTSQIRYDSMFLGTQHSDEEIRRALDLGGIKYRVLDRQSIADEIAILLAKENVVALYRGRIEFGPRSLGNRSLLASPRSARTREKLNIIKDREMFRPLAPIVCAESFERFFDGIPNRYMMMTAKVKEAVRSTIPAVVHADGTARVQTIDKRDDPFLHSVLERFEEYSNIPVLVNTSFNVRGKPIDATPHDALASFYTTGIDFLVLEKYLVEHPNRVRETQAA